MSIFILYVNKLSGCSQFGILYIFVGLGQGRTGSLMLLEFIPCHRFIIACPRHLEYLTLEFRFYVECSDMSMEV